MKIKIAVLLTFIGAKTFAQNYSVSTIPTELKENAHAVVRNQETEFFVKNIGEAVSKVTSSITILDENGEKHTVLTLFYDKKFNKNTKVEATIYDSKGEKVKKLKQSDIVSFNTSSSDEVGDGFVKYTRLTHSQYPYTIAYTYEYTTTNMMFYPVWEAIADNQEGTAVEKSSLKISMPKGIILRYKEQNMPKKMSFSNENDMDVYNWKVENLKAIEKEPNSPPLSQTMPMVYTAPSEFMVEDYHGSLNSWQDFGKFNSSLSQNRDVLPQEVVQKIESLVKDEPNREKKIQKIYEYLQANTRYMSIQLGIGGWQPFKAEEVSKKGYGDCKALANYTYSMLKKLGIPSYYTLVYAGKDSPDIQADFPSSHFNHAFLCVPNQKDTLWLECTSQTNPFGYLGSFTSDRHVLLITENGGKLVKTPTYQVIDNQQITKGNVVLGENNSATANIEILFTGMQQEMPSALIHQLGQDEQKKWILNNISLSGVELESFSLTENKAKIPSVKQIMKLSLRNITTKSGTRVFFMPNIMSQSKSIPLANANRKSDFVQSMNYLDTDSITFQIPKNYSAEFLPEPIKIQSKFGTYSSSTIIVGDKITYFRQLTIKKGQYPPSQYAEWVDFRRKIVKADKSQVVLVLEN
jgi:Domain of Unknown Function with PDB structure (DUF3857)/Transglutaminase-like superfamily